MSQIFFIRATGPAFPMRTFDLGPNYDFKVPFTSEKLQFGDGDNQKLSNASGKGRRFYPKSLLWCKSCIFRISGSASRVRAFGFGLKHGFWIKFTLKTRNLSTVITKSGETFIGKCRRFYPKSLLWCPSFILSNLWACFSGAGIRFRPKLRFLNSIYFQKLHFVDVITRSWATFLSEGRRFYPKKPVVRSDFHFSNLWVWFPGASFRFMPKIRFLNSIHSQKSQFDDGDHQKLSNVFKRGP